MTKVNKLPTTKLWNPKSFIIFSVFFSFLPAGIMCALNYGRSGSQKKEVDISFNEYLSVYSTYCTAAYIIN